MSFFENDYDYLFILLKVWNSRRDVQQNRVSDKALAKPTLIILIISFISLIKADVINYTNWKFIKRNLPQMVQICYADTKIICHSVI